MYGSLARGAYGSIPRFLKKPVVAAAGLRTGCSDFADLSRVAVPAFRAFAEEIAASLLIFSDWRT